jgi:hypothetical protein
MNTLQILETGEEFPPDFLPEGIPYWQDHQELKDIAMVILIW